jgi:hypothetical protein
MRHATHQPDDKGGFRYFFIYTAHHSPTFAIGNPDGMIPADYLPVNSQATYLLNFSN